MTSSLWLRLVLPLALISGGLIAAHYWSDHDGLFLNLATEVAGIVVTVAYVDWIISRHEAARWRGIEARIASSLKVFVNSALSGIRGGLGFGPDVMNEAEIMSGDAERGHREVLRVAEHVLGPSARARVEALDQEGWGRLASHLQWVWVEAERILDRFSGRLEPRQVELLLDIQQSARSALLFWSTFPDLAGVARDRLPETRTPPGILQEHGYDSTARELRSLMTLARQLVDA